MMRLLKRLRHHGEIKRLHERAVRDAYPRSYIELCRTLMSLGETVRAMDMAREGLAKFPHSDDLRDVLRHTWRHTKSAEIDVLKRRCRSSNDPAHFQDLASIYMQCEEFDEALDVAEEMGRRFPKNVNTWLMQAEILFKRFYKDHVASDATRAIVHLKHAIEIEEANFQAHYLLTKIYHYIGAISKALFHLYKALDIRPDDEAARNLYDILVKLPLEKEEESILLREIEENEDSSVSRSSSGAQECAGSQMSREARAGLLADISRLSLLNGVTRVAFASPELAIVALRGEARQIGIDESDPLCEIARRFRKAATVSAKRMGIGAFQSSVLEAKDRLLQFHSVGMTVVLVESDDPNRGDVIKAECANFVASCLRTAKETVNA